MLAKSAKRAENSGIMASKIEFDLAANNAATRIMNAVETPGALKEANNTVLQHNRLFSAGQEAIRRVAMEQDRILRRSTYPDIRAGLRLYTTSYLFTNPEGAKGRAFKKGLGAGVAIANGMSIMDTAQYPGAFESLKRASLAAMEADSPEINDFLAGIAHNLTSGGQRPVERAIEIMAGAALMRHVHTLGARAVWWRFSKNDL